MALFKEYKKKSISDPRETFESLVTNKLNDYSEQLITNSLNKHVIEKEQVDFLLEIAPFIDEYYKEDVIAPLGVDKNSEISSDKTNMNNYVIQQQSTNRKGAVYDNYMKYKGYSSSCDTNESCFYCFDCKMNKIYDLNESSTICPQCGIQSFVIDSSYSAQQNNYSYSTSTEQNETIPYYCYKRQNHFAEWLSQLQGTETTYIPETVYESLRSELKKERITNLDEISYVKIRMYLKKLRLNKYYEHIPHIIQKLKNVPPPNIKPEIEETLRQMFFLIQEPFQKHCPKNRKNFLSYSYTLHKMCEILEEDELLEQFTLPLLKSRDKLSVQDKIWKGICSELNWQFIPTI